MGVGPFTLHSEEPDYHGYGWPIIARCRMRAFVWHQWLGCRANGPSAIRRSYLNPLPDSGSGYVDRVNAGCGGCRWWGAIFGDLGMYHFRPMRTKVYHSSTETHLVCNLNVWWYRIHVLVWLRRYLIISHRHCSVSLEVLYLFNITRNGSHISGIQG